MKTLLNVLFLLVWIPIVYAAFFYDGAREAWKKHRLGNAYEGPAED